NLYIVDADGLRIVGNQFLGPANTGMIYGRNLEIADNTADGRAMIWATDRLTLTRNSLDGSVLIRGETGRAAVTDNHFGGLSISGLAQVQLEGNDGQSLTVEGAGIVTATRNRVRSMEMEASG